MGKSADYRSTVSNRYRELLEHCRANLDRMDQELPPAREGFGELLGERGVSRRDFIKWTS